MTTKTTISATQHEVTISATMDTECASPMEALSMFKQVFLGLTYTHEQWKQAINNEIENF